MSDSRSDRSTVVRLHPPAPVTSVQGTLALDLDLEPRREPPWPPPVPGSGPLRRDIEDWSRRYAQAAVEIVGGDRPVTQLLRWSSREVYLDLQRRALLVARAGRYRPGQGRVQPVRPRVQGVHTCFLSLDTVEVGVHVKYGPRSRAVAARFETTADRYGRRWCCTALEFA